LIILSLFGTTTGLEVLHLPLESRPATLKFEDAWIEISPSQANVSNDKDLFVVLRKIIGPHTATWIGLYRLAREIGYDRPGSFFGAGAWIVEDAVDVRILVEVLQDLSSQIQSKAMNGDRFVKRINDSRSEITQPEQLSNLTKSRSKVTAGCHPNGESGFIVTSQNPFEVIDWAQRALSASNFSKIIIGTNDQTPEAGTRSSINTYRSLAFAIEASYQRKAAEHQSTRNELNISTQENTKKISKLQDETSHLKQLLESANNDTNKYRKEARNQEAAANAANAIAEKLHKRINELSFAKAGSTGLVSSNDENNDGQSSPKKERLPSEVNDKKKIQDSTFFVSLDSKKARWYDFALDILIFVFLAGCVLYTVNSLSCQNFNFGICYKNTQINQPQLPAPSNYPPLTSPN